MSLRNPKTCRESIDILQGGTGQKPQRKRGSAAESDPAVERAVERLRQACDGSVAPCRECTRTILNDLRREVLLSASQERPKPPEAEPGHVPVDGVWQAGFLRGVDTVRSRLRALAEEEESRARITSGEGGDGE